MQQGQLIAPPTQCPPLLRRHGALPMDRPVQIRNQTDE
jgi:hypothetical protein